MEAEPLPFPAKVPGECDIYPAPSQWISFHRGLLFAECAAPALICTSQTSRLLSQPRSTHPPRLGELILPAWGRFCACRLVLFPEPPPWVSLPFPSCPTVSSPHCPGFPPSAAVGAGAQSPGMTLGKGWELPAPYTGTLNPPPRVDSSPGVFLIKPS